MDWIDLDEDKEQWKALVNKVLNLRLPSNVGKFWRLLKKDSASCSQLPVQ
jgi:hypothetical protein